MRSRDSIILRGLIIIFLLIFSLNLKSGDLKESLADSLGNSELKLAGIDKIKDFAKSSYKFRESYPAKSIIYADSFFNYIDKNDISDSDYKEIEGMISSVYLNKACGLIALSDYIGAIANLEKAAEGFTDNLKLASVFEQTGTAYYYLSYYKEAMDYYLKALIILNNRQEHLLYGQVLNNIAVVLKAEGDFEQALEYFLESLEYKHKHGDIRGEAVNLMNIGIIYRNFEDIDKALEYYNLAMQKAKEAESPLLISKINNNLGNLYSDNFDYEKAENYYFKSLELKLDHNDRWGLASLYNNITEMKIADNQSIESITAYADSALRISEETGSFDLRCSAYKNYADLEKQQGNQKASYLMMKRHYACQDSMRDREDMQDILEMEGLLRSKSKQSQIAVLEQQNARNEIELEKSNLRMLELGLILFFLLIFFVIFYVNYKSKKRSQLKLKLLNTEIEHANSELKRKIRELEEFKTTLTAKFEETISDIHKRDNLLIIQSRYIALNDLIESISIKWMSNLEQINNQLSRFEELYKKNSLNSDNLEDIADSSMKILYEMSHKIDDFRDFFKPQASKSYFYLKEVIEKAVDFVIDYYKKHNIDIVIEEKIENLRIEGYPNELALIILNIINNSLDAFLARNIENPVITISIDENFGRIILKIQDNAGGISENILDRIFDAFVTQSKKKNSSGLGLYIAREIIQKRFKGSIHISNELGGALVKVIF